ncbi:pentatricopeptide repeat-containing protein [Canna indica]|uniref:Pentatricopeptide repeat-containing protein n=1 Tax=Canna indica TaxID=4628 RepID=A0AAQ3KBR1_9LILI|nr:pentatricopeptide repeat-containing protein [Canna indica]
MIWPLGDPSINLTPELERWTARVHSVRPVELQNVIRELRKRRRYRQALEVSDWMKSRPNIQFMPSDHAVHLDLIGQVINGLSSKNYFNSMREKDKNEKTFVALLKYYVRECLTEKALSHLQKMKELGLVLSLSPLHIMISIYTCILASMTRFSRS